VSAPTATLRQPAGIEHAKRALLARHHVVAPSLKVADAAAASVFGAARLRGPIARDVIAQVTSHLGKELLLVLGFIDLGPCETKSRA